MDARGTFPVGGHHRRTHRRLLSHMCRNMYASRRRWFCIGSFHRSMGAHTCTEMRCSRPAGSAYSTRSTCHRLHKHLEPAHTRWHLRSSRRHLQLRSRSGNQSRPCHSVRMSICLVHTARIHDPRAAPVGAVYAVHCRTQFWRSNSHHRRTPADCRARRHDRLRACNL
jgi:hypothetical protein